MPAVRARHAERAPLKTKQDDNVAKQAEESKVNKVTVDGVKPLPQRYKPKMKKTGFMENEMENKENEDWREPSNIMYSVRTVKG